MAESRWKTLLFSGHRLLSKNSSDIIVEEGSIVKILEKKFRNSLSVGRNQHFPLLKLSVSHSEDLFWQTKSIQIVLFINFILLIELFKVRTISRGTGFNLTSFILVSFSCSKTLFASISHMWQASLKPCSTCNEQRSKASKLL